MVHGPPSEMMVTPYATCPAYVREKLWPKAVIASTAGDGPKVGKGMVVDPTTRPESPRETQVSYMTVAFHQRACFLLLCMSRPFDAQKSFTGCC